MDGQVIHQKHCVICGVKFETTQRNRKTCGLKVCVYKNDPKRNNRLVEVIRSQSTLSPKEIAMPKIKVPRSVIIPIEVRTTLPASKLTKKTLQLIYAPLGNDAPKETLEIKQVQRANPVE